MKTLKNIFGLCLALLVVWNCSDDDNLDYLNEVDAPSEVTAIFRPVLDESTGNLGLITITPNAIGAVSYNINFGDGTEDTTKVNQGESVIHQYAEHPDLGSYTVTIEAVGITGLTTIGTELLPVVFEEPIMSCDILDPDIDIVNHLSVSKRVDVTVAATYGISYSVYFGEPGYDEPETANNGDTVSYTYQEAGLYTIRVVAMSASVQTTECIIDFEVTEILQPITPAPTPPSRDVNDVISIYSVIDSDIDGNIISSVYSDVIGTNHFPDWDQGNQGSDWATFDLDDADEMLQYINLSYQGIALAEGTSVDVSGMEFLHMDVWTADEGLRIETSLISLTNGEKPVWSDLTAGEWTSIEIPISDYTDQGLTVADIYQLKFVGDPWAAGTVFIDNLYFYKEGTGGPSGGPLPINFESPFQLSSFDGGDISVIANPDPNGNPSSMVAKLVKNAGQPWGGSKITIDEPFVLGTSESITVKVWSPRVGLNLLMKFEDAVPWPGVGATEAITVTTTVANAWEELTFVFPTIDTAVEWYNMVLIMDDGTEGDGSANYTIYIDDISTNPALDFEPKFELSSFDGGDISVIANPDSNGNPSSMVAQLVKNAGQPWGGSKITVPIPFNLGSTETVTAKVWSPRVGLNLLMKFEDAVPWPGVGATEAITATTTVANAWEELTFVFPTIDTAVEWYNMVLIMDDGTEGDGSANYTIYVDDISNN